MSDNVTDRPWKFVTLINEDGTDMNCDQAGEYVKMSVANSPRAEFSAVMATKSDGKLYDICHVGNGPDSPFNAAHIVKCVNLHDELVEALTLLLREVNESGCYFANDSTWVEAIIISEKALAKADGEK
jgi:hypothetical protein